MSRTPNQCNCEHAKCDQHVAGDCKNEGRYFVMDLGVVCPPCCTLYPAEWIEKYDHPQQLRCESCGDIPHDDLEDRDGHVNFHKRGNYCRDCHEKAEHEAMVEREFYGDGDDDFADPGGRSALRAATEDNPRDQPCGNCGAENRLTPKDVALGYQCDTCADRAEGIYTGGDY